MAMPLTHAEIWNALDRLASMRGYSASGLARKAGLDPTTFNRSKRFAPGGKPRWPSTESIARVLDATGASLEEFLGLVTVPPPGGRELHTVPLIGLAQAGNSGYFDDAGFPAGAGWDDIAFPEVGDEHAYALEISGDSMSPVFREGDRVVVSPQAGIRRGDRVVVKTREGEVMAKELARRTARRIELRSLNPDYPDRTLDVADVAWMARIVWASQ
jgi:phage repressor protein C with HTH and peptisase S24 domain